MSEEQFPRSADDDVDPEALAAVQRALGDLAFLRPDDGDPASTTEPMPPWVWDRISAALAEAHDPQPTGTPHRRSRLSRWGGGLIAASVAVLAVGVAVTAFRGTSGTVVAGEAPAADAGAAVMADSAAVESAPQQEAVAGAPAPSPRMLAGPRSLSFAGIPPIRKILGTSTDYSPSAMEGQVTATLEQAGVLPASDMPSPEPTVEVPTELSASAQQTGLLQSAQALRDCVTRLTHKGTSTALVLDQSTFKGQPASIIVSPDYDVPAAQAPDMSLIEVWVVDPDCNITWGMSFRMSR
ncbi:MAG: hypothetical protein GC156_00545 [Actinomycetales bacterium]|nr:hypothetical protein [Actinomycetales bacterium]